MTALPVMDPPDDAPVDDRRIVGVLLAAGLSSRFGTANKLLAEIGGQPIVSRSARTLCNSTVDAVVVVLGHEAERIRSVLPEEVSIVERTEIHSGLAGSVATGVNATRRRGGDAVLIALGDMPWIEPESVDALVAAYRAGFGNALAAAAEGERGNPVLFDEQYFDTLQSLTGDVGGRTILRTASDAVLIETHDSGVLRDVDEPEDIESFDDDDPPEANT